MRPRDEWRSGTTSGTAPRVLLIEDLDALGADLVDGQMRAEWLAACGARVTWRAVSANGAPAAAADAGRLARHLVSRELAADLLKDLAASASWDAVLLASAAPGGGPLARWLPASSRWWPTGVAGPDQPSHPLARLTRGIRGASPLASLPGVAHGAEGWLAGSAVAGRPSRQAGLPLWDGDLVLAPQGLSTPAGLESLAAFAAVAEDWSGVDLVSWSHPVARIEDRARVLGVPMRVHQVGPPPRPAEWAWWSQASAAVMTDGARISAGMVLRALAAGCPLLWVEPRGALRELAEWMSGRGCARVVAAEPRAVGEALGALLEREGEVEAMVDRGRALAAAHDPPALIARLASALAPPPPARAAA